MIKKGKIELSRKLIITLSKNYLKMKKEKLWKI